MSANIRVALLGLGEVGETFAEKFLEQIQENQIPVEIVAVAHRHLDSPVALGFLQNNIPVYKEALDVAEMGQSIDIIFDLSGDTSMRQNLRLRLLETRNHHTIIAPEVIARLLWHFFDQDFIKHNLVSNVA